MNKDKIYWQVEQINSRIFKINDIIYELNSNPELNISEIRKAEKAKNKLIKQKDKFLKKIEKGLEDESALYDQEWQDDS